MSRLTPLPWKQLKKAFERAGFKQSRQEGSHIVMEKDGVLRPIVIPRYDQVGLDVIQSNLKSAGLSRDEFLALLKRKPGKKRGADKKEKKRRGKSKKKV